MLRFWWPEAVESFQVASLLTDVLKTVRRYQAHQLLLDLRQIPLLDAESQRWVEASWLPRLRSCSLRRLALLLPTDTYNRLVVESLLWVSAHESLPYEVQYFTELPAALDWLTNSEVATADADWPRRQQEPLLRRVRRRRCPAQCLSPA
ncbi:hypothetical protein HNQ93_000797 [Hymenobacter luteus]|uniref:STAS/SEC14 domain-containing protein n=2 Tax=Hymenobacter TaxID=89966 RepID=A0A7W9WBT1_9BACT|nr:MULTISPECIES: hypothetical protein [Hymenobacter]MBB4599723.1 hypothetical protein [Hymenobacter latericoloratus]MBB6057967.1 hypothetical protein [Hymenobacter luteus]